MVFQNYALYPHKTVEQNMSFGLKLRNTPKDEIQARVKRAADILHVAPYLSRYPRQLSGGQRQRVAMGRAIVRDPQVFLFDEPLSNLDAQLRVQMRAEIKELHQRLKTTTVYVTHDQIEAMTMADRIVVMRDGVVEQIGAPLDLYDRPATLFVASFIGSPSMNLLKGTVAVKGKPVFVTEGGVELPLKSAPPNIDGRPCIYGIRPEHLAIGGGLQGRGFGGRADWLGNPGVRQGRRPSDRHRLPRPPIGSTGRKPAALAKPGRGPPVRRRKRQAAGIALDDIGNAHIIRASERANAHGRAQLTLPQNARLTLGLCASYARGECERGVAPGRNRLRRRKREE